MSPGNLRTCRATGNLRTVVPQGICGLINCAALTVPGDPQEQASETCRHLTGRSTADSLRASVATNQALFPRVIWTEEQMVRC